MAKKVIAELVSKEILAEGIYKFAIKAKEIASVAKAGQFLEIKVTDTIEPFLRRPISIFNINGENVEFIFQVKGQGTELLSNKKVGDKIDVLGPLGKGSFTVKEYSNVAIIGGGIGTYPLYELAKELKDKAKVNMYLGFRDKSLVTCEEDFEALKLNKLVVATDDGSYKEKGYAIDFMRKDIEENKVDKIFACGPLPMLRAVKQFAIENNISCEVSLEERMGCGIGACLGCAIQIGTGENAKYGHVCKDGPVFNAKDVEI